MTGSRVERSRRLSVSALPDWPGYDLPRRVQWCCSPRPRAPVPLYRLAAEILRAVEAGVFPLRVGWHWQDCPVEPVPGVA
jgi:hypothetical protein